MIAAFHLPEFVIVTTERNLKNQGALRVLQALGDPLGSPFLERGK
jgi:hypothetical protein